MNHLLIPFLFLLYVSIGISLANPEPYTAYDVDSTEYVTIYPVEGEVLLEANSHGEIATKIVIHNLPDEVWVIDPMSGELDVYLPMGKQEE